MYKKYLIRTRVVAVACVLAFTTMACGVAATGNAADTSVSATSSSEPQSAADKAESKTLESVINNGSFGQSSDDVNKEETVYVAGDATGANNSVTVSEWLKNKDGSTTITDESKLSDIKNIKGNEEYTVNKDGTITWNANGNDIYYQGTTSTQLPVDVRVSYKLDGKDITPQELAGKSGTVTIRFDYTNRAKQTVQVNGQNEDIYTPFAMISGVMLPTDKFSHVQVSNGKVISDANAYIVMGVGLPGLKDSLKLNEDKLKDIELTDKDVSIPDYVEITADTNDFQLGMTMTMATSDALSDLGFNDLDNSDRIDEVNSKLNDVTDGVDQLVDGSGELKDGTGKLYDGTKTLKDGAGKLNKGAGDLQGGISDYTGGVSKIADGASQLDDGLFTMKDGVTALWSGTNELSNGITTAYNGSSTLKSGTASALTGACKLKDGAAAIDTAVAESVTQADQQYWAIKEAEYLLGKMNPNNPSGVRLGASLMRAAVVSAPAVTLDLQGGSYADSADANVTVNTDTDADGNKVYSLDKPKTPDREGYTFKGWYETVDTTADPIADDAWPISITKSVTLYAGWVKVTDNAADVEKSADTGKSVQESGSASDSEQAADSKSSTNTDSSSDSSVNDSQETTDASVSTENADDAKTEESAAESAGTQVADQSRLANVISSHIILFAGSDSSNMLSESGYNAFKAQIDGFKMTGATLSTVLNNNAMSGRMGAVYQAKAQALDTLLRGTTGAGLSDWANYSADAYTAELTTLRVMEESARKTGTSLGTLKSSLDQLSGGASDLAGGIGQLDNGAGSLNDGLSQLNAGGEQLSGGVYDLAGGVTKLKDGSAALRSGTDELSANSGKLNSGAADLVKGTSDLDSGAADLQNGAGRLDEGAADLTDGIVKFNDEGISKISEAFDGDIRSFSDRLQAINKASADYTSFGGADKSQKSNVKFFIKTAGITTEDD